MKHQIKFTFSTLRSFSKSRPSTLVLNAVVPSLKPLNLYRFTLWFFGIQLQGEFRIQLNRGELFTHFFQSHCRVGDVSKLEKVKNHVTLDQQWMRGEEELLRTLFCKTIMHKHRCSCSRKTLSTWLTDITDVMKSLHNLFFYHKRRCTNIQASSIATILIVLILWTAGKLMVWMDSCFNKVWGDSAIVGF